MIRASILLPAVIAMYVPFCAPPHVRPTHLPSLPAASLWTPPDNLPDRDLFYGPWGANPGMTIGVLKHKIADGRALALADGRGAGR